MDADANGALAPPGLGVLLREWGRIGCLGFGGPPTHIAMFRDLCVERRAWITPHEFEDAIAACNLLPGPASTQLSIYCAWRLRGRAGAVIGGLAFILPGLAVVLALSALFLAGSPPRWVRAAGAGAGCAVAAVAVHAAAGLLPASWQRAQKVSRLRWPLYLAAGVVGAATLGPWLVLLLIGCGLVELAVRRPWSGAGGRRPAMAMAPALVAGGVASGGLLAVGWVALKVGLLSYGGGFVIIPLMQADAVDRYHWMSAGQFLTAVSLGQITPGPVVHTVAAVGYAAAGVGGGLLAAAAAFTPSFLFIAIGGPHFDRLRASPAARSFLDGTAPAAVGAILGSAIPLARALHEPWQYATLGGAVLLLVVARRGVVLTLLAAAAVGVLVVAAGGPLPT
ncbi:chromate efflux transporter [Pseudofrankia sp. DC12]|uniref:chromate efflux transporter n=1 Tax=Pseudofrankia sp. DC12 TaxID=683315 RepID=UPI0005F7675F|nr:chromate efflux transporter [Pseudofrankia sp. DC12]